MEEAKQRALQYMAASNLSEEEKEFLYEINKDSVFDPAWLKANLAKLKELFPPTWTHIDNLSNFAFMYQSKVRGIDWRSVGQFVTMMLVISKIGICQYNPDNFYLVRATPD